MVLSLSLLRPLSPPQSFVHLPSLTLTQGIHSSVVSISLLLHDSFVLMPTQSGSLQCLSFSFALQFCRPCLWTQPCHPDSFCLAPLAVFTCPCLRGPFSSSLAHLLSFDLQFCRPCLWAQPCHPCNSSLALLLIISCSCTWRPPNYSESFF